MAKKIKLDLSQFKASGVYTLEFDASESVILTNQTIRLVVGFSNKGPFNAPVYIPDASTAVAVFGDIDKTLEAKGSFFHRSIFTCLNTGPVFALNLLKLNNDESSADADLVKYIGFSTDTEQANGVLTSRLYASYYNKERFWYADPQYFLATLSSVDQGRIFSAVNLGKSPMSIIVRKSTDADRPLQGYDIFAMDWFGAQNVPSYVHPYDYISDWFIDVIAVSGDWTDYAALSKEPKWSRYFNANGFIKSQIDNFLSEPDVNIVTNVTGCLIIDFVDLNGNNQYIQTLVNNNTPSTGLFCAVDEDGLENICNNPYKVDLVGHHLIDEVNGADRDLVDPRLNFLSYTQNLFQDYLYKQSAYDLVETVSTNTIKTGSLFSPFGAGATAGVPVADFDVYSPTAYVGGLHYVQSSTLAAADATSLKDFLTISGDTNPYIVGQVTIPAGLSDNILNQFTDQDIVKLKVASVREISGQLQIPFSHPLDTAYYRSLGVVVQPVSDFTSIDIAITATSYLFAKNDYLDIDSIIDADGTGTHQTLIGQGNTQLFQDTKSQELSNGDQIFLDAAKTSVQYLAYELTIDRDQFGLSYARAFTNPSLDYSLQDDIVAFGASYSSNNSGLPVAATSIDIVSSEGGLNDYIEVLAATGTNSIAAGINSFSIDTSLFTISVGDLLVSTDQDLCLTDGTNRQQRLTKVVSVAQTTTQNFVKVTTARPIYYYSGGSTGIQVQRFKSISEFTTSFDFKYLEGFKMKETHKPNGTDARISQILDVMYETNIAATLAAKDVISYRYIIDTFSGQILPNSKYQLSKLAMMRQKALAIINAPSMEQFRASTDPRFTAAPTSVDPYPSLEAKYIAEGGNLALNPSYTFSLPTEDQGAKYCAFYGPYLTVRENNKNINVPPAAYISNNFLRKFANGEPYAIVAGQKRGVISANNLIGTEYDLTDEDRSFLEPMGYNPIIKRRGLGVVIFGNGTAFQKVNSAFGLVHVRDILIGVENDVEEILANYLFDFNEDSIRLEIKTLVDNYLDGVRSGGGIYAYKVVMDSSNNTPAIIDQNMGIIDVIIEPARGIQKFINRVTVTRTGGISSGGFIQFA